MKNGQIGLHLINFCCINALSSRWQCKLQAKKTYVNKVFLTNGDVYNKELLRFNSKKYLLENEKEH